MVTSFIKRYEGVIIPPYETNASTSDSGSQITIDFFSAFVLFNNYHGRDYYVVKRKTRLSSIGEMVNKSEAVTNSQQIAFKNGLNFKGRHSCFRDVFFTY